VKKIIFVLVLFAACMTLSFGETYAYNTCDPNNIFVPCSYGGYNYDTVMRGGGTVDFYIASSFTVAHINQNTIRRGGLLPTTAFPVTEELG